MQTRTNGQYGQLAAGAAIGLAAGLALPLARKALMQAPSAATGDWAEALKAEHRLVEKAFEAALATTEDDVMKRDMLLAKIAYALTKHAIQEENVIYPAMMQHGQQDQARALIEDHGRIKTFIFELRNIDAGDVMWRSTLQGFYDDLRTHIREEEDVIFPAFHAALPEAESARLTAMMNWEGFKVA
ncbi:MAG: hemerythrin domain-containing protein [Phenylobacterium sp.]|uniref:hemerythrin domain-containing protein n=1 Tax=Phenylobacterium sp. TaxID=1871053 RepID=UPI001A37D1B3|nr:hemerythrin domain-containing protein [Phenylobacterium sp.]MBL8770504.1 hemerythrin domain-containing protein [Phenylobacterium sp.]